MKMTMRWYGETYDTVSLSQLKQLPYLDGVISTLYGKNAGERWEREEIKALKSTIERAGLQLLGIESVNIHDAIKTGGEKRDFYIDQYIQTLKHLGQEDIHLVCYNFMPVFDWTRSNLAKPRQDGSTVLAYDQAEIDKLNPETVFDEMNKNADGFLLPGWEPERLGQIRALFDAYKNVNEEALFQNLVYFLKAILPICQQYEIYMAIHPDDPGWSVFGLPRIITNQEQLLHLMAAVDSPYNGVTLCTGSLGSNPQNDIPAIIRSLKGRIPFAHIRNIKHTAPGVFEEAAHLSSDGSYDMVEILSALRDIQFDGVIRPDHGRMIWDERAMPGYGLYDRALGAAYLRGIWETLAKSGR